MKRTRQPLNRLRILRAEKCLTQTDVATLMKWPTKFRYWQIENNRVMATSKEAKQLARLFDCDVADLGLVVKA